jgi:nicotinamide-nucleotide amidase
MPDYIELVNILKERKLTLSTAESCTGGLIAKKITDVPGSSEIFTGGVVSYSNEMKMKWLGVQQDTLERYGAVSEQTVREMLIGIKRETTSDIAVAVSGIAGPSGGTFEKPVGTVFIGVSFGDKMVIEKHHFKGIRQKVREESAEQAREMILKLIGF